MVGINTFYRHTNKENDEKLNIHINPSIQRQHLHFKNRILKGIEAVSLVSQFAGGEEIESVVAGLLFFVGQHHVLSDVRGETADSAVVHRDPVVEIVVFASPTVERVREAVNPQELLFKDGNGTTDYTVVGQFVIEHVYVGGHVPGQNGATVYVVQVLRYEIHVVKYETGEVR